MDFGMPTLIGLESLADCFALCAELGLRFVEINLNLPQYQPGRVDTGALEKARERGLYCTFHLDENLSPADFNEEIADAYLRATLRTIALAKQACAPLLNMHMADGVYFTLPDKKVYLFDKYRTEYLEKMRVFRDACAKAIGGEDILICVENTGGYHDFQREAIGLLLQSPAFALTLDIGHSHTAGRQDEPFILAREDRLRHMHIHDARGGRNHLVPGDGDIDIAAMLALAEKNHCRCVLETKSIEGLRKAVRRLGI